LTDQNSYEKNLSRWKRGKKEKNVFINSPLERSEKDSALQSRNSAEKDSALQSRNPAETRKR